MLIIIIIIIIIVILRSCLEHLDPDESWGMVLVAATVSRQQLGLLPFRMEWWYVCVCVCMMAEVCAPQTGVGAIWKAMA